MHLSTPAVRAVLLRGILVFCVCIARCVIQPACRMVVQAASWASGDSPVTMNDAWFLVRWAKLYELARSRANVPDPLGHRGSRGEDGRARGDARTSTSPAAQPPA